MKRVVRKTVYTSCEAANWAEMRGGVRVIWANEKPFFK